MKANDHVNKYPDTISKHYNKINKIRASDFIKVTLESALKSQQLDMYISYLVIRRDKFKLKASLE